MNDLSKVLLRFRRFEYAIQADVSMMFLQVELHPRDRKFHRFLWREKSRLVVYEFLRHLFGNTGSPAVAIFCIKQTARLFKSELPSAAEMVLQSSIVDDMLDSRPTLQQASDLAVQLLRLFSECGMTIAKFFSNNINVLKSVPLHLQLPEAENLHMGEIPNSEFPCVKTLRIRWNAQLDCFFFHSKDPR